MKKVSFNNYLNDFTKQLPTGAFLTVKYKDKINTMAIGWGLGGIMWSKPVLMVAVRYSRYTYEMIENAQEFTVSVPASETLKEELIFCGSKSGRDYDKFKECNLTPVYVDNIKTPVIGECDLHFICKNIYQQSMEPSLIKSDSVKENYPSNNFHVLYFGEIIEAYKK